MDEPIRKWAERRESRRGFLAMCGKVMLALGAAMAGTSLTAITAWGACCTNNCGSCPNPPAVCPQGCLPSGNFHYCCDSTGTNTCHICTECDCGLAGLCFCETDNTTSCASLPC